MHFVSTVAFDRVAARSAEDDVVSSHAVAGDEQIVSRTAVEKVRAGAATHRVIATIAEETVTAEASLDDVRTTAAVDDIIAPEAVDVVAAGGAVETASSLRLATICSTLRGAGHTGSHGSGARTSWRSPNSYSADCQTAAVLGCAAK